MTQSKPTEKVEPMEKRLSELARRTAEVGQLSEGDRVLILSALDAAASLARAEQIERDAGIVDQFDMGLDDDEVRKIAAALRAQLKEQRD